MTYRVTFAGGAHLQYHDLPEPAQDALRVRVVDLADAPWENTTVMPPGDEPSLRETLFGSGSGLLAFHVNDREETIRIFNIIWIS